MLSGWGPYVGNKRREFATVFLVVLVNSGLRAKDFKNAHLTNCAATTLIETESNTKRGGKNSCSYNSFNLRISPECISEEKKPSYGFCLKKKYSRKIPGKINAGLNAIKQVLDSSITL